MTILQTNFVVDERNISTTSCIFAEPGFEAAINKQLGLNFMFTNPNKTTFQLHVQLSIEQLFINYRNAFPLFLSAICRAIESYEPKTVKQYSAFVPDGQVRIADEGRKGMEVDVHRTISYEGSVVVEEMISSDFYAPMLKIELHPLKKDATNYRKFRGNEGTVDSQEIKILPILKNSEST